MTLVTQIFDNIKSNITDCLPAEYKQLENPFIPEDNATNIWNKAFGVAFGPGVNTEQFAGCAKISCVRDFEISLVNKLNVTANRIDKKDDQQKSIVEDMMAIKKCFEADPDLDSLCSKCVFTADGGVEFVDSQRGKFFLMVATIECTFFDDL